MARDDHDALWDECKKAQRKQERESTRRQESEERLARVGLGPIEPTARCFHCDQPLSPFASAAGYGLCDDCLHRD
jgi:hypothetical protein